MGDLLLRDLSAQNENRNDEYLDDPNCTEDMTARLRILLQLPNVNIKRVKVVHNNYLRGMYELKKLEYKSRYGSVTEKTLVHATSEYNVESIIRDNLDWRRVMRNRYGKGVSFSDNADYANYYCNISNGSARAFIIADVLVSSTVTTSQNYNMEIPHSNADTSVSNTGRVYVKFNDNEFLLKYIVYYTAPDRTSSKYHRNPLFRKRRFFF